MGTCKDIPGFPGYRVGDDGSVWSCWTKRGGVGRKRRMAAEWRRLALSRGGDGYLTAGLIREGEKTKRFLVHRLVLEVFTGPCPEGMECRRGPDPDRDNNDVGNLRWAPISGRSADIVSSFRSGRKLDATQAAQIRDAAMAGVDPDRIARRFGVTMSTVKDIRTGKTWASLGAAR